MMHLMDLIVLLFVFDCDIFSSNPHLYLSNIIYVKISMENILDGHFENQVHLIFWLVTEEK